MFSSLKLLKLIQQTERLKRKTSQKAYVAVKVGLCYYGLAGILAGEAKCFYGFVGFDCVATTGEEAKNPKRNIPLAIVISLFIIFFAYFGISTVLTMMWPYYDQNPEAPFPHVFQEIGWIEIKWIVSIGAIFALCTSLLGAMFPLPRVLYAMGTDGIIYKFMKRVHKKTQTPLIATIISGLLAAIMATLFNLHQLIDMMSIGTLLAYTIVAVCVLVLHYDSPNTIEGSIDEVQPSLNTIIRQITNFKFTKQPNTLSMNIAKVCIVVFSILSIALCTLLLFEFDSITALLIAIVIAGMILTVSVIARQPKDESVELSFKVPFVPLLPCLSILINLYLMFQLDGNTWIRFGVWLVIGKIRNYILLMIYLLITFLSRLHNLLLIWNKKIQRRSISKRIYRVHKTTYSPSSENRNDIGSLQGSL